MSVSPSHLCRQSASLWYVRHTYCVRLLPWVTHAFIGTLVLEFSLTISGVSDEEGSEEESEEEEVIIDGKKVRRKKKKTKRGIERSNFHRCIIFKADFRDVIATVSQFWSQKQKIEKFMMVKIHINQKHFFLIHNSYYQNFFNCSLFYFFLGNKQFLSFQRHFCVKKMFYFILGHKKLCSVISNAFLFEKKNKQKHVYFILGNKQVFSHFQCIFVQKH